MKKFLAPAFAITFIIGVSLLLIFYGRGYRFNLSQGSFEPKGLLVANSQPNGAQIFVNDKLSSATNTTITLEPSWYNVRMEKEGYSPWQKDVRVQGEVVAKTDAVLFPINPSLSPITVSGVSNPKVSQDTTKIVFSVSKSNNGNEDPFEGNGVFILELTDRPLGATRNTRQIAKDSPILSFENATYQWSPTGKQLLALIDDKYYLLDTSILNTAPQNVTLTLDNVYDSWNEEEEILKQERLGTLKPDLAGILNNSATNLIWSPDETKILYQATASATIPQIIKPALIGTNPTGEERNLKPGQIYVYDIKEDKNFFIVDKNGLKPSPTTVPTKNTQNVSKNNLELGPPAGGWNLEFPLMWFPTSSHLLLAEEGKISVMDYDGLNKVTLYAGPFFDNLIAPWPNGSKIVILTTLNPQPGSKPNLYAINIR
ncbi:PEGA domain-containing protein [Candidatus Gottesmanbacteria bacterium]|nr:PEGA domain-containing protein [Candidatus Gottesmanbacteria bacterium]